MIFTHYATMRNTDKLQETVDIANRENSSKAAYNSMLTMIHLFIMQSINIIRKTEN